MRAPERGRSSRRQVTSKSRSLGREEKVPALTNWQRGQDGSGSGSREDTVVTRRERRVVGGWLDKENNCL